MCLGKSIVVLVYGFERVVRRQILKVLLYWFIVLKGLLGESVP